MNDIGFYIAFLKLFLLLIAVCSFTAAIIILIDYVVSEYKYRHYRNINRKK